jgi:hypothetical protein
MTETETETDTAPGAWLDDWVHGSPVGPPPTWHRPGIALLFNLECAGCVGRAVPWFKRLAAAAGDGAVLFAVHSAYGHRVLPRERVAPQVAHYATAFAALPFPVALDLDGSWAEDAGAQGTPHWFVWDADGRLERSVYGSQENALTRLGYLVEAWGVAFAG